MIFEVGKCYEHPAGIKMRMLAEVDTCYYGRCLITEDNFGRIAPMGTSEESAVNWTECEDFKTELENGTPIEKIIMSAPKEIDISSMNPDAVTTKPDDAAVEETENASGTETSEETENTSGTETSEETENASETEE